MSMQEGQLNVNVELELAVLDFFADAVKVLGLPKSVGEIYGLLFISREPMSLDDLVERLDISKGSGSQGLKVLRTLGAVVESTGPDGGTGRKVFYEASLELKRLVGGFIREKVRPHLKSAKSKVKVMHEINDEGDGFYDYRIKKLDAWRKRAGLLLPILQKVLGS